MSNESFYVGGMLGALVVAVVMIGYMAHNRDLNYTIPKSEYNELRQDGKVWAYVRKDTKP